MFGMIWGKGLEAERHMQLCEPSYFRAKTDSSYAKITIGVVLYGTQFSIKSSFERIFLEKIWLNFFMVIDNFSSSKEL